MDKFRKPIPIKTLRWYWWVMSGIDTNEDGVVCWVCSLVGCTYDFTTHQYDLIPITNLYYE